MAGNYGLNSFTKKLLPTRLGAWAVQHVEATASDKERGTMVRGEDSDHSPPHNSQGRIYHDTILRKVDLNFCQAVSHKSSFTQARSRQHCHLAINPT